jgi:C1A family cysteine protease
MLVHQGQFNVRPDKFDSRDFHFKFAKTELAPVVDLRPYASPVEDQRHLGSCSGQATVGAYELLLNKLYPDKFVDLSRLFVYFNARLLEGFTAEDNGAFIRDAVKSLFKFGVCTESAWPYLVEKFAAVPDHQSYREARKRMITQYYRLNSLDDILNGLNSGRPVVAGMQVYDSFLELDKPGVYSVSMPAKEENMLGTHAITLVGYDLSKKQVIARNSFGEDWGDRGYFYISFDYVRDYFNDCWMFDINVKI